MKSKCFLGVALLAAAAWGADSFHPLDVKTGLWETTMHSQIKGAPPIPPDVLNGLTPEQRAKLEAAMKAAQGAHATTYRSCLTKEKLNQPLDLTKQAQQCTHQVITSNSSRQEVHFECSILGGKQSGTVRLDAVDSENIKGTIQINMAAGAHTSATSGDLTSKWLGSACSEKDEK